MPWSLLLRILPLLGGLVGERGLAKLFAGMVASKTMPAAVKGMASKAAGPGFLPSMGRFFAGEMATSALLPGHSEPTGVTDDESFADLLRQMGQPGGQPMIDDNELAFHDMLRRTENRRLLV